MAYKKCELLAPAGSIDALKAAVYAGADAVYFGGGNFNARAFAKNFNDDELEQAFKICRIYGVKAYVVLNTILTDNEIPKALAFVDVLEMLYKPDAYIVQDVGLITALKKRYPNIPLHASTQMQLHSSLAANAAHSLGLERIVFARELSEMDIEAVAKCGLETEVFVHGAICVCQSGGCLMSSFIGGRSGNRGKCAQPCRQSYNGKYPLSLKDMCYAMHIPTICNLGVDCLKIEGRMKSPEYVYETVSVYRKLLDERRAATVEEIQRLSAAFSRSGFTDGYFTCKVNAKMFGVRTDSDKEISRNLITEIKPKRIGVKVDATVLKGEECSVTVSVGGCFATVKGQKPFEAVNQPLTAEMLSSRLSKTGDTPFFVEDSNIVLDDGLMLPMSAINALRRCALEALQNSIIENNTPKRIVDAQIELDDNITAEVHNKSDLVARFECKLPSLQVLNDALNLCDRVDVPLWCDLPEGIDTAKISAVLPRTVFDSDTKEIEHLLEKAKNKGITQLTVPNIGMLPLCKGFTLHGDYTLNVTNAKTAVALFDMGFESVTLSPEIVPKYTKNAEYIVYGKAPLMHTETCIISNITKCNESGKCEAVLKDKTGACFPIMREYKHRNVIYNSVPTYLLDKKGKLNGLKSHILFFTNENDREVLNIFRAYKEEESCDGPFTRAAFKRSKEVF